MTPSSSANSEQPSFFSKLPYPIQAVGRLGLGGLAGYAGYWLSRAISWIGSVPPEPSPYPYVMAGLASSAIEETARLVHMTALKLLGERTIYEPEVAQPVSLAHRLRHRSWKIISSVEKANQRISNAFSRLLRIRTTEEIKTRGLADRHLHFVEILRREFWNQIRETLSSGVPQTLGVALVELHGYQLMMGAPAMASLQGFLFLVGLINKVGDVYKKIHEEEERLQGLNQQAVHA